MKKFSQSFKNALTGFKKAYKEEPNLRIHTVVAVLVLILSYGLGLSNGEWLFILLAITLVLVMEIINSIFERMIDMVKPTLNDYVRDMKDMMASGVVLVSFFSVLVGGVILLPKVIQVIGSLILLVIK